MREKNGWLPCKQGNQPIPVARLHCWWMRWAYRVPLHYYGLQQCAITNVSSPTGLRPCQIQAGKRLWGCCDLELLIELLIEWPQEAPRPLVFVPCTWQTEATASAKSLACDTGFPVYYTEILACDTKIFGWGTEIRTCAAFPRPEYPRVLGVCFSCKTHPGLGPLRMGKTELSARPTDG